MIGLIFSRAEGGGLSAVSGSDPRYFFAFLAAGLLLLGIGCYFLFTESEDPDYAGHLS